MPVIKSYGEISAADLEASPVWINCHVADLGEPWYDDAAEDDYWPFAGPVDLSSGNMYVVKATAVLADRGRLPAFVHLSPAFGLDSGDAVDAAVFVPGGRFVDLGPPTMGLSRAVRTRRLAALARSEREVFPVRVTPDDPALPVVTVFDWFGHRACGDDYDDTCV